MAFSTPPVPTGETLAPVEGQLFSAEQRVHRDVHGPEPDLVQLAQLQPVRSSSPPASIGATATSPTGLVTQTAAQAGTEEYTITGSNTYAKATPVTQARHHHDYLLRRQWRDAVAAYGTGRRPGCAADGRAARPAVSAVEGSPVMLLVATFTDADPNGMASYYSASISWGDGSYPVPGTIKAGGGGVFDVYGTHTYTYDARHPIK